MDQFVLLTPNEQLVVTVFSPVTSLVHQGWRTVFWEWPKFFKLCPMLLNNVEHIFPGVSKIFLGGFVPLVTGLTVLLIRQWTQAHVQF